jgi:hypothetical protein
MLKHKEVKSNDGKDVGEIKDISQNYVRVEKGTIHKDKFWIPKYVVDAFDGKKVWLLISAEELLGRYFYGSEPPGDQYTRDFEEFKKSSYGRQNPFLSETNENVRVTEERTVGVPTEEEQTETGYRNIRDTE